MPNSYEVLSQCHENEGVNTKDDVLSNHDSIPTTKDSSDNLSSLDQNLSSTEIVSSNDNLNSIENEQLCHDMEEKLQLQVSTANDKTPLSRPRCVFTYASEQNRDLANLPKLTNSSPNTKVDSNDDYDYVLNRSSSEFDLGTKYYSPRNISGFQSGNAFRKDFDNYNGKNKDFTSNLNINLPSWSPNRLLSMPSKLPMTSSSVIIPTKPPPLNYYNDMQHYTVVDNWRDPDLLEPGTGGAMATPHGTITLRLRDRVRVDMTLDSAVRVVNFKNNIVVCLSATGSASALLHPNGRVYQYGSRVEILAHDQHSHNNKYAKMWYKGVSFTSDQCALVYLVDSAGTRTTTDNFSNLSEDFSLSIFYNESRHGPQFVQDALNILQSLRYWITDDGTENWIINNVRISQTADGLVRIGRNSNKFTLRTSPANGSASVISPFIHCTGSLGQTRHLFVRRGERRMHYDGTSFIVRNAGHSAGFDDKQQLKVY